jgi:hypothetical protein
LAEVDLDIVEGERLAIAPEILVGEDFGKVELECLCQKVLKLADGNTRCGGLENPGNTAGEAGICERDLIGREWGREGQNPRQ